MENLNNKEIKIFQGAGWLIGLAVAIAGAIVVFTLSDNFAAAISAAVPIGVASGISLDKNSKEPLINSIREKSK